MSDNVKLKYKRSALKELESKFRHLRYNLKYGAELLKTSGGGRF